MSSLEETLNSWSAPPGKSEGERIENAINSVKTALEKDDRLNGVSKVYLQGSYRNRVNVRSESDVDLGILYTGNTFGVRYPDGYGDKDFGLRNSDFSQTTFKDQIGEALVNHFGAAAVTRGNKAFDISENTYRVEADVAPVFMYKRFYPDGKYMTGVQLLPDQGPKIINWPERLFDDPSWPPQHYEEGVAKNTSTGKRFKGIVRILKRLKYKLADEKVSAADNISGFEIECLVFNVPDEYFVKPSLEDSVRGVIAHIWSHTKDHSLCSDWTEVSKLKYLFPRDDEKVVRAHEFADAAWDWFGPLK